MLETAAHLAGLPVDPGSLAIYYAVSRYAALLPLLGLAWFVADEATRPRG